MSAPEQLIVSLNPDGDIDVRTEVLRYSPKTRLGSPSGCWFLNEARQLRAETGWEGGEIKALYCAQCGRLHGVGNKLAARIGGMGKADKKVDYWCDCGQKRIQWHRKGTG